MVDAGRSLRGTRPLFVDSNGTYSDPSSLRRSGDDTGHRRGADWTGNFAAIETSEGSALEAFIVALDLGLSSWSLADAAHVGLDVAVDLGTPTQPASCPRLARFTLQVSDPDAGTCGAAYDVGDFCNPVLP